MNLYAYCGNDPVNYSDRSGHSATLVLAIIMAGIATFTLIVTEPTNKKGESKSEVTQDLFNIDGPKFDDKELTLFSVNGYLAKETWYFGKGKNNYFYISAFSYDVGLGIEFDSEDFIKSANVSAISSGVKIGNFELSINIGTGDFFDFSFGLLG